MEKKREQALNRKRTIIYNNDSGDAYVFNSETSNLSKEERIEKFLQVRTKPLLRTNVTTIFYCTGTVGLCGHNSKVASVIPHPDVDAWAEDSKKDMKILLEKRIDPLSVIVEFCKKNNIEVFWSLRMNDIHDSADDEGAKFILKINKLKQSHPEYLLGWDPWPSYGRPTSLDYSYKEVRDTVYKMVEEVCQKYDIDGVHLDFFRHPIFFREPAFGFHATQQQLNMMTELIRNIREMIEREERKKGDPILLAIRVPDSVEYCKTIGIDLENWLKNKYIDILIPSGYCQLNYWEYSVKLGHKYGVKVYIDMSESRISGDIKNIRNSIESYRARAANIWLSGADGIHLFNFFNLKKENLQLLNEMSDPEKLQTLNKVYIPNVLGIKIGWAGFPTYGYCNIPILTPDNPVEIKIGENRIIKFPIADDLNKNIKNGLNPEIKLQILIEDIFDSSERLKNIIFNFNDFNLDKPHIEKYPEIRNKKIKSLEFQLPVNAVKKGFNTFEIINKAEPSITLYDLYLWISYKNGTKK